ncbi:MAG: histidinol-phosphate transaminase [Lutibacter sp.]|nr:MAG: histidinol-phosphate transaminase [Lutibacter sp.]
MFDINKIIRKNIFNMQAYSSARDEFKGKADIWLDANENPNETELNRYPDPLQLKLKTEISKIKNVPLEQIFIGNGSDEAIDLLFRAFCEPRLSKAYIFPPTYGMYKVSAAINNIDLVELPLTKTFELPSSEKILSNLKSDGLIFICSPNNPTGNSMDSERIKEIATNFNGLIVVDEAYIDFSINKSAISLLQEIPNLVVLQTFSKAYGLAGARVGTAFASPEVISILNKIKPPYNINSLSIDAALNVIKNKESIQNQIDEIILEREILRIALSNLTCVNKIFPSDANFLLVEFTDSQLVFAELISKGIVVRNRNSQIKNCLRITIGTKRENEKLMNVLNEIV